MATTDQPSSPYRGLSQAEAAARLAEAGPNELHKPRTRSLAAIMAGALREPMFALLLAASALYLMLGDLGEGLFLTAGACVSIGLVVFQEARSEKALAALRSLAEPYARVVRDGAEQRIPARDLAPGDLILIGEGDRAPADAVLVHGDVLSMDESVLTGESAPVDKTPAPSAQAADPEASTLFAGALVVRGQGAAEVVATGPRTALGRIGASLAAISEEPTPLQKASARLVGFMGVAAVAISVLLVVIYGVMRHDWVAGVLAGVTLAISLIPEEFPMVLAVFLALGGWRLARHKVLVRRSAAIEALGGATVLCVDKTGTLTENRMRVARLWADGAERALREDGAAAGALVRAAVLASAVRSVDPMDRAVFELSAEAGVAGPSDGEAPTRTWPLRPERLAVVQAWRSGGGEIAAAKGAPETIFSLCRLPQDEVARLREVLEAMAAEGLRVLAVADCFRQGVFPDEPEAAVFAFRGFVGFQDPVRQDVPAALDEARGAGISVAMITGDYPATAREIARQAGIDGDAGVLTGDEVAAMSPQALSEAVERTRIFARIRPEQKLKLVEAFKAAGEVVVMTGDGVNDAPALQAAHIGIAMGQRGTDVAREAADLVLLDDSFASIVGGVRLGRRIFSNLRRALTYITAIHVPIAGLALTPILMGLPPMLAPMHVVLLELVIDPVCSLVFETEPSESDAMKRRPRSARESLFGRPQVAMAAIQGLAIFAAILGLYVWALGVAPLLEARAVAFAALVMSILVLAFADAASLSVSIFDRRHVIFWGIAAAAASIVSLALFVPAFEDVFEISTPSTPLLGLSVAVALAAGGWVRIYRRLRERAAAR